MYRGIQVTEVFPIFACINSLCNILKATVMERFINPFSDFGFKVIFGQEVSKNLLISFLNSLLEGEKEITDLTFMNPALLPEIVGARGTIYDVYCTTTDDEPIIV